MLDKEITQLASGLYNPLFATRDSIREAYEYAQQIAQSTKNPAAVTTAIHVLLNTIAEHLEDTVRTAHHADAEAFIQWANQESREG